MKKKKKAIRSASDLTTLDNFLKDEGQLEEFESVAIKEVPACKNSKPMKLRERDRN